MARMFVISERGRIRGLFTQKKKLWETMGMETKDLMVAVSEIKFSELNYNKMCKYIKERSILQLYDTNDVAPGIEASDVSSEYIIWEIEVNTFYDPVLPDELEDDEEAVYDADQELDIEEEMVEIITEQIIKDHTEVSEETVEALCGGTEKSREKFSI